MSLENTRFVVIGTTGGIGSALSRRLNHQGAELMLVGQSAERLKHLGAELDAQTETLDATQADALERAVAIVLLGPGNRLSPLFLVVSAVGIEPTTY